METTKCGFVSENVPGNVAIVTMATVSDFVVVKSICAFIYPSQIKQNNCKKEDCLKLSIHLCVGVRASASAASINRFSSVLV